VLILSLVLPLVQPWQPRALPAVEADAPEIPPLPAVAPRNIAELASVAVTVSADGRRWPMVIAIVLGAGSVLRMAWIAGGLIRLRRIRRRGVPAAESTAPDLLQALAEAGADVRYVSSMRQPVTFGLRHPVVLLPAALQGMSPGVQQAVLAHELWHVRRRDWLWSLCEEGLCAIFWFHPAIWYLVAQVQGAREEVVDRLSVNSTNARRCYLEALLAFADEPAMSPAAPFIRRRQLFHRMMLISKEGVMSPKRIVASGLAMAGALVLTGWYGVQAFPLTASTSGPTDGQGQAQAQPRDPRPDIARPVTSKEEELKGATAADPANVANWLALAKLQEERGAVQEAEATLRSAFAATSGSREVLLSQARFYGRQGNFQQSVELLETYAAQNPGDASGHQMVATWYWEKAQRDKTLTPADKLMYIESGIRATDRAIAQRPDYIEALTYKNILLRMKGNLETDPARREQLYNEASMLRNRAIELNKARTAAQRPADGSAPPPPPPPPPQYYEVDGQQAVRIGGEIKTPTKIRDVRPVYPQEAQDARISGMVILEVLVDTQGNVRSARVLRSIPTLDEAALDAVKQWGFTPSVRDGVAVPVVMTVTVNFTLQ
jgi:TonB family protein